MSDAPDVETLFLDQRIGRESNNGAPPRADEGPQHTDMGNSERFVRLHGQDFRYSWPINRWLHYRAGCWHVDDSGEAMRAAKDVARELLREAAEAPDDEQKRLVAWAIKSQNERRLEAMITLARSDLPVGPEDLDADPWVLNCQNGVLDLRTGKLGKHDRGRLLTKQCPVAFVEGATCPRWERFLMEVFQGDEDLIGFVRRAVGYSLTGTTDERALFLLHGTGSNGKTSLVEVLLELLGGYAASTPAETLMEKRGDSIPNDVARLKGTRFVAASETEDGKRFASSRVKQLTGGRDTIAARFMRAEWFEFRATFKIWLASNFLPRAKGDDQALFDRVRLIPFRRRFEAHERDPDLADALRAELPGILAWAVRGCLEWQQRDGLNPPDAVRLATDEYQHDSDQVGRFLEDCCVLGAGIQTKAGSLRKAYEEWAEEQGERPLAGKKMGELLKRRGCESGRDYEGRFWRGVGLRSMTA